MDQEIPKNEKTEEAPQFIGGKKIMSVKEAKEKTPAGLVIMEVRYEDGGVELLSKKMFDAVISGEVCDASQLREKRIQPVVKDILIILREWGIKVGELSYMASLLNQSLDYNSNQALLELLSDWRRRPISLYDVDIITVERILRNKKVTLKDVLGSGDKK